jgi:hypothetical protein
LVEVAEPFGLNDFVTGFRFFQGRITIAESFIAELMDLACERTRLAGRGLEHHGFKPERRRMRRILVVEAEKDRRDPITVREILLFDDPPIAILFQPVSPGHEAADLNLAVLGQDRMLRREAELLQRRFDLALYPLNYSIPHT